MTTSASRADLPTRVVFVGAGRMATALTVGFTRTLLPSDSLTAIDPSPEACEAFTAATGVAAVSMADEALSGAELVVLAVKPQHMAEVLESAGPKIARAALVVSVAAGVTIDVISRKLPDTCRVIRVMPNTPCLVGKGASAISAGERATDGDLRIVRTLLETVGSVEVVSESLIDVVTGLSGSGPAYVFAMIEGLSDGGVRMGLPRAVATRLAAQTVMGAAALLLETGEHPGTLKDAVTSPGGTTIAGLHELENGGFRGLLMNAVSAATLRSRELAIEAKG